MIKKVAAFMIGISGFRSGTVSSCSPQHLGSPAAGGAQGPVFTPQLSAEDEGFKQQFSHQTIQRVNYHLVITPTTKLTPKTLTNPA